MLRSVKAVLEDAQVFIEDDEIYLSLKYKDAKVEDGRIVRVQYPKIRLPIPTKALPEVEEIYNYGGSWPDFLLKLNTDRLKIVPTNATITNELGNKAECNDVACAVINQEVEITEEKAMEILKKEYGCPVKVIQKNCKTCYYHERDIDEYPCNNCDFVEYDAWKKLEDSDED